MNPLEDIKQELEGKGGTASFVQFVRHLLDLMSNTSDPEKLAFYKRILDNLEILPMGEKYNFDMMADAEQYHKDKEHLKQQLTNASEFDEEQL